MSDAILLNDRPVDFRSAEYEPLFRRLQGNIVKGHGRDHTANIFIQFTGSAAAIRTALRMLTEKFVRSAYDQLVETEQYNAMLVTLSPASASGPAPVPAAGNLFANVFLARGAYDKLGFRVELEKGSWFDDPPKNEPGAPRHSRFLDGMLRAANDLSDELTKGTATENLEHAYLDGAIDAMLLLAHNDEARLREATEDAVSFLKRSQAGRVVAIEKGKVKRNAQHEAIEHFGFVDGRSQPLFLASDFSGLTASGHIHPATTKEVFRTRGLPAEAAIDQWNPFEPLARVLLKDPAVGDPNAFGSYYVFRKLEQNVRGFRMAERALADALGLEGADRERARAMVVGRFTDGTPLAMNGGPGLPPAQGNNFRYDGLDSSLKRSHRLVEDHFGLKCPFQAHIRKTNPRQSLESFLRLLPHRIEVERDHRRHRIVRRGITYGDSPDPPADDADIATLPTEGVGLLFACFQSSITNQFAFMQRNWANNDAFRVDDTQLDPIIGQGRGGEELPHNWRREYGGKYPGRKPSKITRISLTDSHPISHEFRLFVKFRGGEFFFAPSLLFLLGSR